MSFSFPFVTELQVLQWAEQICYRDNRDMTSVMIQQVIAESHHFYQNNVIFIDEPQKPSSDALP